MAQAKQFKEATDISGIILTKLDGRAKGRNRRSQSSQNLEFQ